MADDFSAVHLLTPVEAENGRRRPTYVGSTIWPSNRVLEHNGFRDCGADCTVDRPWAMGNGMRGPRFRLVEGGSPMQVRRPPAVSLLTHASLTTSLV
jgi:hypothetical protein